MTANIWTPLGPDCVIDGQMHEGSRSAPISGRITALALDGSTLYVGTAGGGVWRTADDGVSFQPLTDSQASLAVGAIAVDSANHRLFVGTGEGNRGGRVQFGQGVLIQNTQTGTWQRQSNIPTAAPIFRVLRSAALLLEPNGPNPPTVWLGTNLGLMRSADNGVTWVGVTVNGVPTADIASLCLAQDASGTTMLAAVWSKGVWRRNAAGTFDALPTGGAGNLPGGDVGRIALAASASNPQRVYCVIGAATEGGFVGIYRSDDGGQTWAPKPLPTGRKLRQSWYNLALAVHPDDEDTLIFGEAGLWRSNDGGEEWAHLSEPRDSSPGLHSDQHAILFNPLDPSRVWIGNDGGLWLSTDGGDHFSHRNRGLNTLQYYAVVHHPTAESVLLAGAQDNGTQRFTGSAGWNLVGFGDGFYCGIDSADPRYWYGSYTYKNSDGDITAIQRSDSAGSRDSFGAVADGIDPAEYPKDAEPFFVPFVLDPATPSTIYLGTTRLYRSANRGDHWEAVRDANGALFTTVPSGGTANGANSITAICVDPNDPNVVYVGTDYGDVFQVRIASISPDGYAIAAWTQTAPPAPAVTPPTPAGEFDPQVKGPVTDLAVPKLAAAAGFDKRPLYVAFGSDYKSGTAPVRVIGGRIWKVDFSAGGPTWSALGAATLQATFPEPPHLPHELNFVNAIAIDPDQPDHVFIGTHSGVFESTDAGGAWTSFAQGLPNVPVVDMQFHPTRRLLRIATMGRSMWERPVDTVAAPETADVFIRDNVIDIGRFDTAATVTDPLNPPGQLAWDEGVDVKVDADTLVYGFSTPTSTRDYAAGSPIDYIGFQQLEHESFQEGKPARVYVQVTNRGPQAATGVVARAYWARKIGDGFPDLPNDFWTGAPAADPAADSPWQPVGPPSDIGTLPPGAPRVETWEWTAPEGNDDVGIMAVITCAEDPLDATGTNVETIAKSNKHVVVRRVPVDWTTGSVILTVILIVGVAAIIATSIGVAAASGAANE